MRNLRLTALALAALFTAVSPADAQVVRPAPDFSWPALDGSTRTLESLRGQPVMLLIAPSPRDRRFRAQLRELESAYQRVAARRMICLAAFTEETGRVDSDIPVIVATDGPRVAFLYEISRGFAAAMIGADGNLEYVTDRVIPVQRVLDIIINSYSMQEYLRRP